MWLPLGGCPIAATAGSPECHGVAGGNGDVALLGDAPLGAVAAPDQGRIAAPRATALQSPGRLDDALQVNVDRAGTQRPVAQLHAHAAAVLPGAATVGTQGKTLDDERVVNLLQLHRCVAHIALTDRYRGRSAILVRAATPAAAKNIHEHIAGSVVRALAVKRTAAHVALVGCGNLSRQGRCQRQQDGVDHGGQGDAPQTQCCRRAGIEHGPLRRDQLEAAKAAFIDRRMRHGQALESHPRSRQAA